MKAIIRIGCVAFAAGAMGASWANMASDNPVESTKSGDDQPRSLLSRESSAHSIVVAAFEEGGWPKDHAHIHADNAMARYGVAGYEYREPPPPPNAAQLAGKSLLSPRSSVESIVMEAFRATGWSEADALAHTEYALVKAGAPAAVQNTGYQVRDIVIQYCVDEVTYYFRGTMHVQCSWQLFPDPLPQPCNLQQCTTSGHVHWYTMHITPECSVDFEGCVRVWFGGTRTIRNCDETLGCACFVEDSWEDMTTVDCCPEYTLSGSGGCSNCPCPQ